MAVVTLNQNSGEAIESGHVPYNKVSPCTWPGQCNRDECTMHTFQHKTFFNFWTNPQLGGKPSHDRHSVAMCVARGV